jgi:uncharacterized protein (DUF2147 family)
MCLQQPWAILIAACVSRPIVGLTTLSGFTRSGGDWSGPAYDPKSGKSYRASLRLNAEGTLRLTGMGVHHL